jgi:hypothetical protein
MTIELKERTDNRMVKAPIKTADSHFGKHRSWIHCPRCIGGNMYLDTNGEFVCIQCGCSCLPEAVTKTPVAAGESPKTETNLFQEISNALRTQRSGHNIDSAGKQ